MRLPQIMCPHSAPTAAGSRYIFRLYRTEYQVLAVRVIRIIGIYEVPLREEARGVAQDRNEKHPA